MFRKSETEGCARSLLLIPVGFLICMIIPLAQGDSRRPFFNIAHMVNSIKELDDYLARGANAVEMDITFHKNGSVRNVYHGYPCDCYRICDDRESFSTYLSHLKDIVDPSSRKFQQQLTLVFFDLKLDEVSKSHKYTAGEEIAKSLITYLYSKEDRSDCRIGVVVSIGHTSDSDTIRGVQDTFRKTHRSKYLNKIGFDVGLNDDLDSIKKMWYKVGVTSNRWQGDGITNCVRPFKDDARLKEAVQFRDAGNKAFIEKVYDWTIDLTANIRQSLRNNVDAVLTNFPERVHSVLQEQEFRNRYRLATVDDNPFSRVDVQPPKSTRKKMDLDAYVGSVRELTVAFMGYFWDFYRLRLQNPSTMFPLIEELLFKNSPSSKKHKSSLKRLQRRKS